MSNPVKGRAVVVQPEEGASFWQPVPANGHADPKLTPASTGYDGLSMGYQTIAPGGRVREHSHGDQVELQICFRGRGRVMVDGASHRLVPGTACFLGYDVKHEIYNDSADDLVMLWVVSPPGLEHFFEAIGRPRQLYWEKLDPEVRRITEAALRDMEKRGAVVREVSLPHLKESLESATDISLAEALHVHEAAGYFPSRAAEYGEEVRQRIFAPKHIEDHKNDRRKRTHFEKRRNLASVAIDQQVIAGPRQPCHGHDHGDIGQTNCAEQGGVRERFPPPQKVVCIRSGRQRVALMNIHGSPAAQSRSRCQSVCGHARKRHNRQRST
jgi:quercetin dioxygenase-like cupin family protein